MFANNVLILFFHVVFVSVLTLLALHWGKEAAIAWLSLLAVSVNFFVLKQVTLFGLEVTCSDALAVGYLLGLNLIQEFFGKGLARKTIWITFFSSLGFVILSQLHLFYQPNLYDEAHPLYAMLLRPMPRLLFASLCSFLFVQFMDVSFFAFLRRKMEGKYLPLRTALALCLSQTLDTVLFSFLGLYGVVAHLGHIIIFSLLIKLIVILLSSPFIYLSKKMISYEAVV